MLSLAEARQLVTSELARAARTAVAEVALDDAAGRVLAEDVAADRDQPPFDRSTRDGFAVRAGDTRGAPVTLARAGEVAAGGRFAGETGEGQCVEIMTGAPLPAGADAVVMIEHVTRDGDAIRVDRGVAPGENVVARGSELAAGAAALARGTRLDPSAIALLASVGRARVPVHARPRVAILATGAELVEVDAAPSPSQIRNSNARALAAQVARAGGEPLRLPIARDEYDALRPLIERGLAEADLLLLSGGVSAGKYDFVEKVLADLGARFLFDAVAIRPGKPVVFGEARGRVFFGLPGNPLSTYVTFELFARAAIEILGGAAPSPILTARGQLAEELHQRPVPLTVFAPSRVTGDFDKPLWKPVRSQGSGDVASLANADGFVVIPPGVTQLAAGEWVSLLSK